MTEQLIADLVANGGELWIDEKADKVNYEARVRAAIKHGRVPEGQLLITERVGDWRSGSKRVVRLQDKPEWMTVKLEPVPVPATLRSPNKLVKALQDDEAVNVTAAVRNRGLRLIQALVAETERRGYSASRNRSRSHSHGEDKGLFVITIEGHGFGVDLSQVLDRIPHVPSPAEERRAARDTWYRIPSHDHLPSSRLTISLTNGRPYWQSSWTDSETKPLEDHLAQIMQELELRAAFAEEQRVERERQEAARRRAWEEAMRTAKMRFVEEARAQVLKAQVSRWRFAQELDEYLLALRSTAAALPAEQEDDARAWIMWVEEYRARIDPLAGRLALPSVPEPRHDDLKTYLPDGMSPYGPSRW
ncbi:hypothetical protein ACWENQ_01065 [Nonomuraea sp. NPDC004354]